MKTTILPSGATGLNNVCRQSLSGIANSSAPKLIPILIGRAIRSILQLILIIIIFVAGAAQVFAASAGPNNAGTGTNLTGIGTISWGTLAGNITAAGAPYATVTCNSGNPGQTTNYLKGTNYGFSIPTNATIAGITVVINRLSTGGSSPFIRDSRISLLKAGVIQSTNKAAATTDWPTGSFSTASYGGTADLWATTWTPADINDANFGVVLAAINANTGSNRNRDASVDYMQITVTYTLTTPTITSLNTGSGCVGSTLIINGSNLSNASSVTIGGTLATITAKTASTVTVNVGSGTTGTVTVYTPVGNATSSTSFTINQLPFATVTSQSDLACFGISTGQITIQASGGLAPYTFSIHNGLNADYTGSGNPYTFNSLSAGNYRVRVKDSNQCESIQIP